jgi:hypothetical protein
MQKRIFFWIFMILPMLSYAQNTWYVQAQNTTPNPSGASWNEAFTDLNQALALAQYGDAIWIAQGVYKPSSSDDRMASFMLKNGVKIYGGFSGDELSLDARNPALYPAVLSGDIGLPGDKNDNSLHVLVGIGLDSTTLLDGLVVSDGNSYNYTPLNGRDVCGAGLLLLGAYDIPNTAPLIRNCKFLRNEAFNGGGIYADWENPDITGLLIQPVNPVIDHCIFEFNRASYQGGAYYKRGHPFSSQDTLVLSHCRFSDNKAYSWYGGGVLLAQPGSTHVRLEHCIFERDSAITGGGFMFDTYGQTTGYPVSIIVDSCLFIKNVALDAAGFCFEGALANVSGNQLYSRFKNTRFEGNKTFGGDGSTYFITINKEGWLDFEMDSCTLHKNETINTTISLAGIWGGSSGVANVRNCTFTDNFKTDSPTGIAMPLCISVGQIVPNFLQTRVENCLFANNGGGILAFGSNNSHVRTEVNNCTFYNNNQYIFWKNWFPNVFQPFDTSFSNPNNRMHLNNCIIWEPESSINKTFYNNNPTATNYYGFRAEHCLFFKPQVEYAALVGGGYTTNTSALFGIDPMFQDPLAGDFRLQDCSPAKDTGDFAFVQPNPSVSSDLQGNPRVRFGRIDLGAFESQDSCLVIDVASPTEHNSLKVWPNPGAEAFIYFSVPEQAGLNGQVTLMEMNGKTRQQVFFNNQTINQIAVNHLPQGMYTIVVRLNNHVYSGQWMKI